MAKRVGRIWLWFTLALAGLLIAIPVAAFWPRSSGAQVLVPSGEVDGHPLGSVTEIRTGLTEEPFFLVRVPEGFLALSRRSPHKGDRIVWVTDAPSLDSVADRGYFLDPVLDSRFDRYGRVRSGPASRPMDYFPVIIENRKILVDVARPIKRQGFQPSQAARP